MGRLALVAIPIGVEDSRMEHDVIVPLDGSPQAAMALGPASALARYLDWELVAVSYHDQDNRIELMTTIDEQLRVLGQVKRRLVMEPLTTSVAKHIGSLINQAPGRLVCMSTRGLGRSAALVGSVATEVFQLTSGPIVLIGAGYREASFRCHGPLVVAVADSEHSEALLPTAEAFATAFDYELDVFTVADGSDAAGAIVEHATNTNAALIAMATHNPNGVERYFEASTTTAVLREASCPVVTLSPAGHFRT